MPSGTPAALTTRGVQTRVGPPRDLTIPEGASTVITGPNGAGKTTTMRILSGETEPYGGSVTRSGEIGYLPQDSKEGDIEQTARARVLSARGLDQIQRSMAKQQEIMETTDGAERDKAIAKFSRLEERYQALGGYEANAEAAQICDNLGLPSRILDQQLKTLSGGQRRRVELAQILFASR
ncbi:ABC transporter ATP-binding protein, partial [Klebsiella pneumoniae]